MPRALVTGITGQDGSYLADFLLEKGWEVHGTVRSSTDREPRNLRHLLQDPAVKGRLFLHAGQLDEAAWLRHLLQTVAPDHLYHLACQTHVGASFDQVEASAGFIALGTLRLLEAVRDVRPSTRLFYASSSEVFGRPEATPQDEQTPFRPVTPYGCAKTFATNLVRVYRESFGLFVANGILYNHESPRRSGGFVTQKICRAAAAIKQGRQSELRLGNLAAGRDWGDARDYVRGMWLTLQHDTPEDFVFATGQVHSIEDVLNIAFSTAGLDWRPYVRHDPQLLRPSEPGRLAGNSTKARRLLNWEPQGTFEQLIAGMTTAALDAGKASGD